MEFEISRYEQDELSWNGRNLVMHTSSWGFLCQSRWAESDTVLMKHHWEWM